MSRPSFIAILKLFPVIIRNIFRTEPCRDLARKPDANTKEKKP